MDDMPDFLRALMGDFDPALVEKAQRAKRAWGEASIEKLTPLLEEFMEELPEGACVQLCRKKDNSDPPIEWAWLQMESDNFSPDYTELIFTKSMANGLQTLLHASGGAVCVSLCLPLPKREENDVDDD